MTTTTTTRTMKWDPATNRATVTITRNGKPVATTYQIDEFPDRGGFRLFRVVRLSLGMGSYWTRIDPTGRMGSCDCADATFRRHSHGPCKHEACVSKLIDLGKLPSPLANGEADHGTSEVEDQPLPECFRTGFGTGIGSPF